MIRGHRSWVEISLEQLMRNVKIYKAYIPKNAEIMAVIKADAYGHGDQVVGKFLSDNGIHYFAVSNIDEAIHIRKAQVEGQILVLGYTPVERMKDLAEYNITQALLSEEYDHTADKCCNNSCCTCEDALIV